MAFNGSGTFNRLYSWVTDAANGLFVSSTRTDADSNDIAAGLSNCICKDGQTTLTANIPMSGFKLTGLGLGSASTDSARVDNANAYSINEFRMTLTSGAPVTTADVTNVATIYVTPYKGNRIALYDGTNWHMRNSAEMSLSDAGLVVSTMYDLFCYDNSGTPTLEALAWTNDTSRATALTTQDGVLVKSGATTRRYLGSFRTGSLGTFYDEVAHRYVWNYYNRVRRPMRVTDPNGYNYTTAVVRQARASAANQLDFIIGYAEDPVIARLQTQFENTNTGVVVWNGLGLDSTTASVESVNQSTAVAAGLVSNIVFYQGYPGIGRHYLAWLEYSAATGTTTWHGGNSLGGANLNGLSGEIFA